MSGTSNFLVTGVHAFESEHSEMDERTRTFDWSKTPIGPIEGWPQSLKIAVRIMLDSRYAMWLGWGPDFTFFYNDAYARMTLGEKHPWALGRSAREVWSEIWSEIGPRADSVVSTGKATWDEGLQLFLERQGFLEETYHTFSYSPIPGDGGQVGGMLCVVTEDTERTIGERRLRTLQELAARTTDEAKSAEEACRVAARTLGENPHDLPFVLIYLLDGEIARLAGMSGLAESSFAALVSINIHDARHLHSGWPLDNISENGRPVIVADLERRFGPMPGGPWPESSKTAILLPIAKAGQTELAGYVITGVSPRLSYDDKYKGFIELLTSQVASAVTNARAYEEERRRAEALAELDRAKTSFFSNVSHEFRTPLTLMLGPIDELLSRYGDSLSTAVKDELDVVYRNGRRLLRLVNSLLDVSRVEAGRVRAIFRPTDLGAYTTDLASVFRSACERAGLRLVVDCPSIDEFVFVDCEMWEKIVFNLLSNAFKFTFVGEIAVRMRRVADELEVSFADTGTGIPSEEIPRLFERFHRIDNARGRTHEGSGIGLALVHDLVKLHGGNIRVESTFGRGSTFVISLPFGSEHLPVEQIGRGQVSQPNEITILRDVEEVMRWLPDEAANVSEDSTAFPPSITASRTRIDNDEFEKRYRVLVADDNADMRSYIVRLLSDDYRIEAVADGEAALASVRERVPDLLLTDVMMPRLDGFGLLSALRADPRTRELPIIMLSARAGEESRVEGMESGADDYLVKPFTARELLARVAAHLQMSRMRRESRRLLSESEARWRGIFECLHEGFFLAELVYDASGVPIDFRFLEMNAAWQRITGLSRELSRGRTFKELVPRAKLERLGDYAHVVVTGTPTSFVQYVEALDRWFDVHAFRPETGRFAVLFLDVTARRRDEDALKEADRRKDEFLAMLAHELRNPLAPIRNSLEIVKISDDSKIIKSISAMMERQVAHMVRLVDDLLDVSRITRGKIELRKEPNSLDSIIAHAIETNRPAIESAKHELTVDLPRQPIMVHADAVRLSQVFSNLLNNACKYSEPHGFISLTAELRGENVIVSVKDRGIGIAPEMLETIFEMFTQVDQSLERSRSGLGIGLTLVQRLVELHGGTVAALSDGAGQGSEFIVQLPVTEIVIDQQEPLMPAEEMEHENSKRRILVVDDNRDSAVSLGMMLSLMGNAIETAHDGLEAVEAAQQFRPDVILLDIGLPKLNGYEACRRIRQQNRDKDILIIACTGWGQDEDIQRAREAGFDRHLVKPVDLVVLENLLNGLQAKS